MGRRSKGKDKREHILARLEQRNSELAFLADGVALDVPYQRELAGSTAYWPKFRTQAVFSTVMLPGTPSYLTRFLRLLS
jgi:hypothetical protein